MLDSALTTQSIENNELAEKRAEERLGNGKFKSPRNPTGCWDF